MLPCRMMAPIGCASRSVTMKARRGERVDFKIDVTELSRLARALSHHH